MTRLPRQFAELETFVDQWAVESTSARHARRLQSTPEQRCAFYDAMSAHIEAVLDYLNARPLEGLAGADLLLMRLMLAAFQVSRAVEIFGAKEADHAGYAAMLKLSRELDGL